MHILIQALFVTLLLGVTSLAHATALSVEVGDCPGELGDAEHLGELLDEYLPSDVVVVDKPVSPATIVVRIGCDVYSHQLTIKVTADHFSETRSWPLEDPLTDESRRALALATTELVRRIIDRPPPPVLVLPLSMRPPDPYQLYSLGATKRGGGIALMVVGGVGLALATSLGAALYQRPLSGDAFTGIVIPSVFAIGGAIAGSAMISFGILKYVNGIKDQKRARQLLDSARPSDWVEASNEMLRRGAIHRLDGIRVLFASLGSGALTVVGYSLFATRPGDTWTVGGALGSIGAVTTIVLLAVGGSLYEQGRSELRGLARPKVSLRLQVGTGVSLSGQF